MTKKQIDFYDKYGYLLFENLFPRQLIDSLVIATNELENNYELHQQYRQLYDYDKLCINDIPTKMLRRIQAPDKILPIFREIAKSKYLIELLSYLLGNNIRLERIKIHFKSAKYGSAINWHQDWAYQPYTNDNVISVAICLDDCDITNGPIYVSPGSHKGPIYPHFDSGVFSGFINIAEHNICFDNLIPLTGKVGDVSLHHYRILHYSPANTSNRARRLLLLRYAAANAWPLMGSLDYKDGFSFEEMQSRIVLGEQTLMPKLQDVPVIMPLPYPNKFYAKTVSVS